MKYIITESQFERYKKLVKEYIKVMSYPGVCRIEVLDEDKNDKIVVNIIFSAEWYVATSNEGGVVQKVVGTILEIKKRLEELFSPIKFYIGHSIRAEKDC